MFPTLEPSSLARPATTGSETAVYTVGMSAFIAELYALAAHGVAMAQIISTFSDTKLSAIVLAVPVSVCAFW